MKTLVYADFDWLDEPMLVGELGYESLRGSDSYSFKYDNDWLRLYGSLFLSADINNYPGQQYTQPDRDIFGCFSDALPDRWGRLLLNRREQILATEEKRPVRKLDWEYINCEESLRIPPLTDIRALVAASMEIEKSEEQNQLPEKKWLLQLIHPGTSLGGARPKAGVMNDEGWLCVAKFPSRNDDYDQGTMTMM